MNVPTFMKVVATESREFRTNRLRMSNRTIFGLYRSVVCATRLQRHNFIRFLAVHFFLVMLILHLLLTVQYCFLKFFNRYRSHLCSDARRFIP
jgi:hypothetical protein